MPTILLISDDPAFRTALRQVLGQDGTAVLGLPNTREILSQPKARQVSGYDLIVAEVRAADHDGLSRLLLFRNLHPNTPFIAVTREPQSPERAFGGAAARALHAWLIPITSDSFVELAETATRALKGESPAMPVAHTR